MILSENALIIFTRIPKAYETKTRLQDSLSGEECADLHKCFLKDIYNNVCIKLKKTDVVICHTDNGDVNILKNIFYKEHLYIKQYGENIFKRMYNAIENIFNYKYSKCILIGADIPEIEYKDIIKAFNILDNNDFVFGPSYDGGYYLVGMKKPMNIIFENEYGNLSDIVNILNMHNLKYDFINKKHDIDEYCDLIALSKRISVNKLNYTKKFLKSINL